MDFSKTRTKFLHVTKYTSHHQVHTRNGVVQCGRHLNIQVDWNKATDLFSNTVECRLSELITTSDSSDNQQFG